MNRRGLALLTLTGSLGVLALSACDPCADVVARIEALGAGETYVVPDGCVITSPVTVPAGATVEGGTFELDDASVTLAPSSDSARPTVLEGATLRGGSASTPLVVARGAGFVAIRSSTFTTDRGIAFGVSGAEAELTTVDIVGNLDLARASEVPFPIDPATLATYGVTAIEGGTIRAEGLTVRRVAAGGLVCSSASLMIDGATLSESVGLGIWADDCDARLDRVEIFDLIAAPVRPGIGIAARASTLASDGLYAHDSPGYAIVSQSSDVTLDSPRVERLRQSGVWVESGSSLVIASGTFDANGGAAIAAVGAARLEVRETMVTNTAMAPIPTADGTSLERIGDGIHVAQLAGQDTQVTLTDVTLVENARVGAVLDGYMRGLPITLTAVRAETSGTELGVIAQNITGLPAGWDASVTRVGSAATLDASAGALLVSPGGLTGILMPPTLVF
ncbi:MAG: right-handed parallel beta-helix repeat-containing protein [Sandaracinaceae bacterium]